MDPFGMARRVVATGRRTVDGALEAPDHLAALWSDLQELVRRANRLMNRADLITARLEHKLDELDGLAEETAMVKAELTRVHRLLDLYAPVLESMAPLGREAAALMRANHLSGLVTLLDELPRLVDRLAPALEGMGSLVPHLEEVGDRMDTVGQVVEGLPGAGLLRRRGQAKEQGSEAGDI